MLDLSAAARSAVSGSWVMHTRVESWLGATLLADDVPVIGGTHETDRSLRNPDRVTLSVPRLDRGVAWDPTADPEHPLAPFGQRLRVSIGVELAPGRVEWLSRGWFLVRETEIQGDSVRVDAVGLLQLIDEARFAAPFQPTGTFVSTLRKLVEPALVVDVDDAPADRAVPAGKSWDEDRLAAVIELLDAWGADMLVSAGGVLVVKDTSDPVTPSLTLSDGAGGTVVEWGAQTSRDGGATVVVARGEASTGATVQGVVYDTDPSSPLRDGGPFNPLPVPHFYYSPLLTTTAECQAAAASVLARLRRSASRSVAVTTTPHPGLQAGDLVTVNGLGLVDAACTVESLRVPLTASSGALTATVRVVA